MEPSPRSPVSGGDDSQCFAAGDLSSDSEEFTRRQTMQRKISVTSELIADSSPMRYALFRHTNCHDADSDPPAIADTPSEGQQNSKQVVENYRNENYGSSGSHEMANIADVDAALVKRPHAATVEGVEQMVSIRKLDEVQPWDLLEPNALGGVLSIVNVLQRRMGQLEEQVAYLRAKLRKTYSTHSRRYCRPQSAKESASSTRNVRSSGDDAVKLRDSGSSTGRLKRKKRTAAEEEEQCREVREIREYRLNRFFYRKSSETDTMNQRPVRHFTIPEPPSDLKISKVSNSIDFTDSRIMKLFAGHPTKIPKIDKYNIQVNLSADAFSSVPQSTAYSK